MQTTPTVRRTVPPTVWLTRGRHAGDTAEELLRRSLRHHKDSRHIDDYLEITDSESPDQVFEARMRVAGGVTVRARLSLAPATQHGQDWTVVAEAEQPWEQSWPSPAGMFWPHDPDADWSMDVSTGLRVGALNPLPEEDKAVRRRLRACARDTWRLHVVVHEAMTTDERGKVPLAHWLPPGLRDRVVEHRAAPHQLRVVNWALREFHAEVPRGGAVLLPGRPAPEGYQADAFAVRAVFLDGSEPAELVDAVRRFDALPRPLPDGALDELTALREDWHLLTLEEELARERALVKMYAEALEAMTRSRDLYREAAERAHEALAAYRESAAPSPGVRPLLPGPASPLRALTRRLERLKVTPRIRRGQAARTDADPETEASDATPARGADGTSAEPAPAAEEQRTVAETSVPGTEASGPEGEVSASGTEEADTAGDAGDAQKRATAARR
ncbi:hypothetical protein GCM10009601_08560 [Streptomyces thermospinosisporus]|uniref:PE-PGRS family protein n=1 Tax=Streptomyces thermospinosisporus TaxID=161482 RepID=A0ABP4JDV3_9ACTN